jgi:hypothetical protein
MTEWETGVTGASFNHESRSKTLLAGAALAKCQPVTIMKGKKKRRNSIELE